MERETKVLAVIWALFGALIFPFFIVLIGKIVILKGNMEIINGTVTAAIKAGKIPAARIFGINTIKFSK